MIVSASVLLPDPFGPMIACTSPLRTTRSIPLRISLSSTLTWRSRTSRSGKAELLLRSRCRVLGELRERHAVQRLGDGRLQLHPDMVRRASRLQHAIHDGLALGGADLRLDRPFERADDVAGGDRSRIAREHVAPARSALPLHEARSEEHTSELQSR